MRNTKWYNIPIPEQTDEYDVFQFGTVMDDVDAELHKQAELIAGLPETVAAIQISLTEHDSRITALENSLLSNVTANSFVNRFDEIEYLNVSGVWNKPMQRIEC